MEAPMTLLRLTLIAVVAAASLGAAARACNEQCNSGFVFSDAEGVCVRTATSV
jgi:hypothetical protein